MLPLFFCLYFSQMSILLVVLFCKLFICESLFAKYLRFPIDFPCSNINTHQAPKNLATVKFRTISGISASIVCSEDIILDNFKEILLKVFQNCFKNGIIRIKEMLVMLTLVLELRHVLNLHIL